jgi:hypothetical protein
MRSVGLSTPAPPPKAAPLNCSKPLHNNMESSLDSLDTLLLVAMKWGNVGPACMMS